VRQQCRTQCDHLAALDLCKRIRGLACHRGLPDQRRQNQQANKSSHDVPVSLVMLLMAKRIAWRWGRKLTRFFEQIESPDPENGKYLRKLSSYTTCDNKGGGLRVARGAGSREDSYPVAGEGGRESRRSAAVSRAPPADLFGRHLQILHSIRMALSKENRQ
jgi:hypothetical protein